MTKNVFNSSNHTMVEDIKLNESQKIILDIWNKFIDQTRSNLKTNVRENFKNYVRDIFLEGEEAASKNYEIFLQISSEHYSKYINFIEKIISLYKRKFPIEDLKKELKRLFSDDFNYFVFPEEQIKEPERDGILIKKEEYQCQTKNESFKESCLLSEESPKDKVLKIDQIPLFMQKINHFFTSNENENITYEDIGIRKEIINMLMRIKIGSLNMGENSCLKIYSDKNVEIYLFKEKDECYLSALISK